MDQFCFILDFLQIVKNMSYIIDLIFHYQDFFLFWNIHCLNNTLTHDRKVNLYYSLEQIRLNKGIHRDILFVCKHLPLILFSN